jgi:hypothetical protein
VDLVHGIAGVLAAAAREAADLLDDLVLHVLQLHALEGALGARIGGGTVDGLGDHLLHHRLATQGVSRASVASPDRSRRKRIRGRQQSAIRYRFIHSLRGLSRPNDILEPVKKANALVWALLACLPAQAASLAVSVADGQGAALEDAVVWLVAKAPAPLAPGARE